MKGEKLLLNRRENELVWYLSKKGNEWIQSDKQVKYVKNNIYHYIMRNQVYVHYRPMEWTTEKSIQWNAHKSDIIKPDAIMKTNQVYFVEVDRTQSMKANKEKIKKYKQMKSVMNPFPVILYVTISEYRQKQLLSSLEGLKSEVLVYTDIK